MRNRIVILLLSLMPCMAWGQTQTYFQYKTDDATLVFFDKSQSRYIPHMIRMYQNGKALHKQIWTTDSVYKPESTLLLLTDWEDDGNGGATPLPRSLIQIGMAPLNMSYYINPSSERYRQLFKHEYTHIVMTDKYNRRDLNWRNFFGTKVGTDNTQPISALWSYLSVPRWYAPRWYHEGIACFMETWLGGGVGRALGGYDEMYFRSIINGGDKLFSVVGLETEGSTMDFQVGANAYLYGTRFVNYLTKTYGYEKMIKFYNRTADSKTFFGSQFKKVYGQSLRKVWNDWKIDEKKHQEENLAAIRQYPITETKPLTPEPLGSVSPFVYDAKTGTAYAAMKAPGKGFAHLTEIDLQTKKQRRLCDIYGIQLYDPAFVALDCNNQRIIYTSNNAQMRGLEIYDIKQDKVVKKKKFQRINNVVYDNAHDCVYGLFSNGGTQTIVRMDRDLENIEAIYAFPFGVSVFDVDISHDGKWLSMTSQGDNGEHTLLMFNTEELAKAIFKPVELITWKDSNLGQFRFSLDDKYLIGSSYYTGVSNLWQINIETREMEMLTNTEIGMFAPVETSPGQLLALQFERDGLRPVTLAREVVKDANAVQLYGQLAYENNREAMEQVGLLKDSLPKTDFGDVYNNITDYNVIKEMHFAGAYPIITGFTDRESWNNVTPVLGYRFNINDPVGLSSIKLSLGVSPWSNNPWKNRFHADMEWRYYFWTLKASWNHTDFYDLFGPMRSSRKGYQVSLGYDYSNSLISPYKRSWGFSLGAYGDMDALPLYQEIEVQEVKSMQTASIYGKWSKTRSSLGAVMSEQGYSFGLQGYGYLAGGHVYPSVEGTADFGTLVPIDRNTSFWLRTAAGHNFGDEETVFGNTYLGGFRNNRVDNRSSLQYRTALAMPGADIDAIQAHSYAKATAELNLRPIRLNDFGALFCYPTWIQCSLFGTGLSTWNPGTSQKMYYSTGVQLTTELVFLNYLKTTLSIGYGHLFAPEGFQGGRHGNEFMISLKLL